MGSWKQTIGYLGLLAGLLTMLSGCTPDKQRGMEDLGPNKYKTKFDAYGHNLSDDNAGRDKGMLAMFYVTGEERREPQLIQHLQNRIRTIGGVEDVKVISYQDNLIVGVRTKGSPRPDLRYEVDSPYTQKRTVQPYTGKPDHTQQLVVEEIRARLQAETRFNQLYVTTNPAFYRRISELSQRIGRDHVHEDELRVLLNEIGYTTKPLNLTD
ncbi:YhcN/YlaJ family sporulation lipoprotein [Brevibacillus fulvus]|uniref:Sporulation protein n=1 Tax=Brevibacillus fulvus TaxID=1125967 RepID=A0A938XYX2_9BACL|nr:YhcN/YlaJ family sporulation lipoprotein [Brevibacillus fulvus]MBM7588432.1 hypothetical protein [Brevibacillus fulvus]